MSTFKTFIYILGREIRIVRILYWRITKGKYLWGMQLGIYDTHSKWRPMKEE